MLGQEQSLSFKSINPSPSSSIPLSQISWLKVTRLAKCLCAEPPTSYRCQKVPSIRQARQVQTLFFRKVRLTFSYYSWPRRFPDSVMDWGERGLQEGPDRSCRGRTLRSRINSWPKRNVKDKQVRRTELAIHFTRFSTIEQIKSRLLLCNSVFRAK